MYVSGVMCVCLFVLCFRCFCLPKLTYSKTQTKTGEIFIVVPGLLGICVWSPRLDKHGNSARGVEFATRLAKHFGWNVFDILFQSDKRAPTHLLHPSRGPHPHTAGHAHQHTHK